MCQEESREWKKSCNVFRCIFDCNVYCFNLFFTRNCIPEPKLSRESDIIIVVVVFLFVERLYGYARLYTEQCILEGAWGAFEWTKTVREEQTNWKVDTSKNTLCVCVDLCERLNGKSFCVKSFVRFVKQLWKFRYSSDERLQFSPDFLLHVCVNARTNCAQIKQRTTSVVSIWNFKNRCWGCVLENWLDFVLSNDIVHTNTCRTHM